MQEQFKIIYKLRGILMAPPFLFFVFVFYGETERGSIIWPVGLSIFGIGVLIRVWAQIHLHYRLKIHKILTTTGPYIYVRNPIYIANTIMLLGTTVLSELIWFLPVMFLWCIVIYSFVIRREEIHLLGKYGNPYSEYLRTTPRWIPAAGRINEKYSTQNQMTRFLWPSILAEVHCLLWLIPLIAKEILSTQY